jgi:hypothetical protein
MSYLVGAESVPSRIIQGRDLSAALGQARRRSIIRSITHAPDQTVARPRLLQGSSRSRRSQHRHSAQAHDFHSLSRACRPSRNQLRKPSSAASQESETYRGQPSSGGSPKLQIMLVASPRFEPAQLATLPKPTFHAENRWSTSNCPLAAVNNDNRRAVIPTPRHRAATWWAQLVGAPRLHPHEH